MSCARFCALGVSLLIGLAPLAVHAQSFGKFKGEIITKWNSDNTNFTLLKDFIYEDGSGRDWIANAGLETDCASIPAVFWPIIGNPCQGPYRKAAVVHDRYCIDKHLASSDDVHEMFYNAMRADGMSRRKALLLYGAVYIGGPHWRKVKSPQGEKIEVYRIVPAPDTPPNVMVPMILARAKDTESVRKFIEKSTYKSRIFDEQSQRRWENDISQWLGRQWRGQDGAQQFRKALDRLD